MLLPGELVCRARRNISPQPCHQVIKAKLTAATSPNSHQKENVVVKLNMRKSLLQTLMACEVCPKRELSLPFSHSAPAAPPSLLRASPCTGMVLWGWGWCRVCCHGCPTLLPSRNSSPTLLDSSGAFGGAFGALVGVGCKFWVENFAS